MDDSSLRMTQPGEAPTDAQLQACLGQGACSFWTRVIALIDQRYPGVFEPEWLFGGRKHGWSVRYKKSKSFCTLVPERERCALLIVFGAQERAKVETIRGALSPQTMERYDGAATYHDGKWLLLTVDSDAALSDVEQLLAVKRKPGPAKAGKSGG